MSTFTPAGVLGSRAKFTLLLLGSLAGVIAAGAAGAAGTDSDAPSVIVKYSETSLETSGGVNELYRRITVAARQVCPAASIRDLVAQQQVAQCREQAIARAISQVGNPQLAALHANHAKNG
jgi:UrcA family protein